MSQRSSQGPFTQGPPEVIMIDDSDDEELPPVSSIVSTSRNTLSGQTKQEAVLITSEESDSAQAEEISGSVEAFPQEAPAAGQPQATLHAQRQIVTNAANAGEDVEMEDAAQGPSSRLATPPPPQAIDSAPGEQVESAAEPRSVAISTALAGPGIRLADVLKSPALPERSLSSVSPGRSQTHSHAGPSVLMDGSRPRAMGSVQGEVPYEEALQAAARATAAQRTADPAQSVRPVANTVISSTVQRFDRDSTSEASASPVRALAEPATTSASSEIADAKGPADPSEAKASDAHVITSEPQRTPAWHPQGVLYPESRSISTPQELIDLVADPDPSLDLTAVAELARGLPAGPGGVGMSASIDLAESGELLLRTLQASNLQLAAAQVLQYAPSVQPRHGLPAHADVLRTGLVYSPAMMLHCPPQNMDEDPEVYDRHPEQPKRISEIYQKLVAHGCAMRMKKINIREVKKEETMLVHEEGVWDGVEITAFHTLDVLGLISQQLEASSSLYINQHSAKCARLSAGGVIEMVDAVVSGTIRNGFAIVRPPGHHAEPSKSMGFCFYNNVAIATKWVMEKYRNAPKPVKRVLILDWDVHHGNGTQDAFWSDPNVLYISVHRHEDGKFFPGGEDGGMDKVGGGAGCGFNVNIPWPAAGMGDGEYIAAFQHIVMPIAYEFNPDLVIISAGFDAAYGDPLGECLVLPAAYAHMTYMLSGLAEGRCVAALEGGYNLEAIANSALKVTETLLGDPAPMPANLTCNALASATIRQVKRAQSRYWKSIHWDDNDPAAYDDAGLPAYSLSDVLRSHREAELLSTLPLALIPMGALEAPIVDETGVVRGKARNVMTLPQSKEDDDERQYDYRGSVICSADLLDRTPPRKTILLFAHSLGDVRIERPGLDIYAEKEAAHLVDASRSILEWALARDIGILDVSVPSLSASNEHAVDVVASGEALSRLQKVQSAADKLLLYIWDNYLSLVLGAKTDVILIGHGSACEAIMTLLKNREPTQFTNQVKAVVHVLAHSTIPVLPKDRPELRAWYGRVSRVFLPHDHALFAVGAQERFGRRLGNIERAPAAAPGTRERPIDLLHRAAPDILQFIENQLAAPILNGSAGLQPKKTSSAAPLASPRDSLHPGGMPNGSAPMVPDSDDVVFVSSAQS
ncbi:Histone deacetylase complex, catalytic component HDA1 [Ceraceosorus bombacis]|uniref:histone deacetylase n=1 Tax=Ceraceosorus bombacis TaxID=401625 RepID=A0A0P1BHM0_9BASI|nr:Histone deacetylase complex, catalytic component HDA1 [Ceraceosorus bombacis]